MQKLREKQCRSLIQRNIISKLNDVEVKEQYQVKISNRFAALENFEDDIDINSTWESITENIKLQMQKVSVIMS
jgi:hypothetical protein